MKQQPVPSLVPRAWFLQRSNANGTHDQRSFVDRIRGAVGFSSAKAAALAESSGQPLPPAHLSWPWAAGPRPQSRGSYLACPEVSTSLLPQANRFSLSCTWVEDIKSASQPPFYFQNRNK